RWLIPLRLFRFLVVCQHVLPHHPARQIFQSLRNVLCYHTQRGGFCVVAGADRFQRAECHGALPAKVSCSEGKVVCLDERGWAQCCWTSRGRIVIIPFGSQRNHSFATPQFWARLRRSRLLPRRPAAVTSSVPGR